MRRFFFKTPAKGIKQMLAVAILPKMTIMGS
jgi:hypothetical protein